VLQNNIPMSAMDPTMVAAVLSQGPKMISGTYQLLKGAFMKDPTRPTMGVMGATQQQLSRAEGMANRSTDQTYNAEIANLDRSSGNAMGSLRKSVNSTADLLTGLAGIEAQKAQNMGQAAVGMGNRKYSYETNLLRAYDQLREDQRAAWEWNQKDKYIEDKVKKESLIQAGMANVGGASENMASLAMYNSMLNKPVANKGSQYPAISLDQMYNSLRGLPGKPPPGVQGTNGFPS
jgi:hypothetical protein